MKKITLLIALFAVSLGYSQVVLEDFEGTAPTLGFSNGPGSATIVTDPATGGTNGNVLQVVTAAASNPWQQAELTMQADYIDLSGATKIVTADVYSTTPFDMLVRADGGVGGGPAATDASHTGSGWETLTFDFNTPKDGLPIPTGIYQQIFFFNLWDSSAGGGNGGWVSGGGASPASTSYVDNVTALAAPAPETCTDGIMNQTETGIDCGGPCGACPNPPTVAAPTPPARPAADVVSIYSDAYADISPINLDAGWCGAVAVTPTTAGGDAVLKYNGQACQGINFASDLQDVTGFTNIHVDLFIQAGTDLVGKVFNMKIVPTVGAETAFNIVLNGISPAPVPGTWFSYDAVIDLSMVPTTDIKEFGVTSNLQNVLWYDNMYLHKNTTTLSTDTFSLSEFSVYPNPTLNNWNISANTNIKTIAVYNVLGKQVSFLNPNASEATIDASELSAGLYFAKVEGINSSKTIKLVKK